MQVFNVCCELLSAISKDNGAGRRDLTEIIHQYGQLCQQQRTLLSEVQRTIQHLHGITVCTGETRGSESTNTDLPTYLYLDHKDEILRTVVPSCLRKLDRQHDAQVIARMVKMDEELTEQKKLVRVNLCSAINLCRAIKASMKVVATEF